MTVHELMVHLSRMIYENPDVAHMEVKVIDYMGYFGSIDAEGIDIDEMVCEDETEHYVFIVS